MKILLIGNGGREDAIHWKLTQEGHEVIAAPGNPGMALRGRVVNLDISDHEAVRSFVILEEVDFIVTGSEVPLAAGIVDYFNACGVPIFGPTKTAARIETSKDFCCRLLTKAGVPVP